MEIVKFGKIVEKDGVMNFNDFKFAGEGDYSDALIAVKEYITSFVDKVIKEQKDLKPLNGITSEDLVWKFKKE